MRGVRKSIAAVVVLYNPSLEVVANALSWAEQVDIIFAIDNSEGDISAAVSTIAAIEKVVLVRNQENQGIARALNIGAEKAVAGGCDFLLTMDQDSKAAPDMVAKMLECLEDQNINRIGIISPFHLMTQSPKKPDGNPSCEEVMTPMTSGNLLNLQAYRQVGPFRDELFIDFVDNEYCLRLRKNGFSVIRANRAFLEHSVGDTKKYWIFVATNHSPLRRYYKMRNRFLVNRLYRRDFRLHCMIDRVRMLKEIGSIILFEQEKLRKLQMMWQGYMDYRRGRFGKYSDPSSKGAER